MVKKIPLTQGKFALVDDEDFEYLSQWKWHYQKDKSSGYAKRKESSGKSYFLHREVAKTPLGFITDHKNGNTLDNRRENLRICLNSQNQANRKKRVGVSKYKGVSKYRKKWRAGIKYMGKSFNLGSFDTEEEAAMAYNNMAAKIYGEFAYFNIIDNPNKQEHP